MRATIEFAVVPRTTPFTVGLAMTGSMEKPAMTSSTETKAAIRSSVDQATIHCLEMMEKIFFWAALVMTPFAAANRVIKFAAMKVAIFFLVTPGMTESPETMAMIFSMVVSERMLF